MTFNTTVSIHSQIVNIALFRFGEMHDKFEYFERKCLITLCALSVLEYNITQSFTSLHTRCLQ